MLARAVYPLGCIARVTARAVNDRPYGVSPQKNAPDGALGVLTLGVLTLDGYSCSRATGVAGMLSGVYSV